MSFVQLTPPSGPVQAQIQLTSSKSESNRALIINALTGFRCTLHNVSEARDTQTLIRLLQSDDTVADVLDAGTTMRFLTAYFAVSGKHKTLTGTPRMCERPIGLLVDALRTLGADIDYLRQEGYPPLATRGFTPSDTNRVSVRGDVSSQYISALLMIGPALPHGLEIELTGTIGSRPYIEMTIAQMRHFGAVVEADWDTKILRVGPTPYTPQDYAVESDWSGASYWYSTLALAPEGSEIELLGLKEKSLQGDSAIADIMRPLGVESTFFADGGRRSGGPASGVRLTRIPAQASLSWDFSHCPDLAQTVAVCCAVKQIPLTLTGIESLKIKETDRVAALQNELPKIGAELVEIEPNHRYEVRPIATIDGQQVTPEIDTYDDHRMAMAFAPAAMRQQLVIHEPNVVMKSYPSFWTDFGQAAEVAIHEP